MLEKCKTEYIKEIRAFIVEQFLFGEEDTLKEDTSFLEEGIIDSTGILELVMFLEEKYGIKIEDSELVPENFDTLDCIAQYMDKKVCAG